MFVAIFTFSALLGLVFGLRGAYTATTEGETVEGSRLYGLIGGLVVSVSALCVCFALYAGCWALWWLATLAA